MRRHPECNCMTPMPAELCACLCERLPYAHPGASPAGEGLPATPTAFLPQTTCGSSSDVTNRAGAAPFSITTSAPTDGVVSASNDSGLTSMCVEPSLSGRESEGIRCAIKMRRFA